MAGSEALSADVAILNFHQEGVTVGDSVHGISTRLIVVATPS